MSKNISKQEEQLKKNGWYQVDILDIRILTYVFGNDVSRRDVKEKFDITEEKSRSRLEKLANKNIIDKRTVCRNCEKDISECECGRYSKQIRYSKDEDDNIIELKFLMDEIEEIFEL